MADQAARQTVSVKLSTEDKYQSFPLAGSLPDDGYHVVFPDTAIQWLSEFNYIHQRAIRRYHVDNLAREMIERRFSDKVQINFCKLRDKYMLVNGQHTLSAIKASGMPQLLSVVVTCCANEKQVADEFARHDTHLTRQLSDSLVAHEIDKLLGVTRTQLSWISAACNLYGYMIGDRERLSSKNMTNDDKLMLVEKYGRLSADALSVFSSPGGKLGYHFTRKTTLACAMHVYNWSPDLCESFYGEISRDDGLRIGDPRKTMLEYWRERVTTGAAYNSSSGHKPTPDHMFIKAQSIAFNYYVKKKPLKLIRPSFDDRIASFDGPGSVRT